MESIPLEDLSSLVEDIHVKTREASQNTDLDMREFLGIDRALQSIQGQQLYRDRLDDLNTEKKARLEILSQNRKDLQTGRKDKTHLKRSSIKMRLC